MMMGRMIEEKLDPTLRVIRSFIMRVAPEFECGQTRGDVLPILESGARASPVTDRDENLQDLAITGNLSGHRSGRPQGSLGGWFLLGAFPRAAAFARRTTIAREIPRSR
jgi:hypothetical protein